MAAITQIVAGHAGALVMELNALTSGAGGLLRRGLDLTEGQLAGLDNGATWSPLNGAAPLGRRRITIPFLLVGSHPDDLGARVAKLMQATQAPWWLRIRRHGASADSWLQCFGCVPQVNSQITGSSGAHMVQGTITAETAPYALGARVDGGDLGSATSMNPATNAWGININSVGGDTATPLLLRMKDAKAFAAPMTAFISVRRRQTPGNLVSSVLVRQGETVAGARSPGANVTLTTRTGEADMSGGACVRATFSSSYVALVGSSLTFSAPTLSGPDVPGVYRVFVRLRRTTANTQQLVLKAYINDSLITPEDITVPANGAATRVVDLGLVQWPAGQPASLAAPLPTPSGATPTRVTLQFWRKSPGAAVVDFDYMCWIPADEDGGYLSTDSALAAPLTQYVVVDGYQHMATVTDVNPLLAHNIQGQSFAGPVPTVTWTGGAPRVRPGNNRLFVVAGLSGVTAWPISRTLNVAYSYWPRYTWLR